MSESESVWWISIPAHRQHLDMMLEIQNLQLRDRVPSENLGGEVQAQTEVHQGEQQREEHGAHRATSSTTLCFAGCPCPPTSAVAAVGHTPDPAAAAAGTPGAYAQSASSLPFVNDSLYRICKGILPQALRKVLTMRM